MNRIEIPLQVISAVSEIISEVYTHANLVNMAESAGIQGDAGLSNKLEKVRTYLKRANNLSPQPLSTLGKFLQRYFESADATYDPARTERLMRVFAENGLAYYRGGIVAEMIAVPVTKSFEEQLKNGEYESVNLEFDRIYKNLNSDPDSAVTASCALLESLFRIILADHKEELPSDLSIKPLWKVVQKRLNLENVVGLDDDILRINSGLTSIVDGIGSLRTHRGSAHGHAGQSEKISQREARLAAHAAFTLASFVLETWTHRPLRSASF